LAPTTYRLQHGYKVSKPGTKCVEARNISNRHPIQNLTRNSYSGSLKVMHLGITENLTRDCIPCPCA